MPVENLPEPRKKYLGAKDVAKILGCHERTVLNRAKQFLWFGGELGESGTMVFTEEEVQRMLRTPTQGAGRPRKPIVSDITVPEVPKTP
jgi:hypothetical protein